MDILTANRFDMYRVMLEKRVLTFINKLQKSSQSKYERLRDLLVKHGPDLGMPHATVIKRQLFELRIRGVQEIRLFCTVNNNDIFVFYGFLKKTNRIPKKDLDIIMKMFKELT